MILMDRYLENLFVKGFISKDTFMNSVRDKDLLSQYS